MARKRKSQKVKKTMQTTGINAGVFIVEIENPNFSADHLEGNGNRRKTDAAMNIRESPIAWYHHHGWIGKAEAKAAGEYRRLYELTGAGGVRAMDTTKEPVDGGFASDGLTDRRMDAAKKLAYIQAKIGCGYWLVQKVCGECVWIKDIPDIHQTKRQRRKAMEHLNQLLGVVAEEWGYAQKPVRGYHAA